MAKLLSAKPAQEGHSGKLGQFVATHEFAAESLDDALRTARSMPMTVRVVTPAAPPEPVHPGAYVIELTEEEYKGLGVLLYSGVEVGTQDTLGIGKIVGVLPQVEGNYARFRTLAGGYN